MAPRKNNDKKQTADKTKRTLKTSKPGVKKTKLKPKSQGAVKLKIPVSGSTLKTTMRKNTATTTSKGRTTRVPRKKLTVQENIELANEVANTQLVKKEVTNEVLKPEYVITITRAEPPSKKSRKKQECVETVTTLPVKVEQTDSEEAFDVTPKKRKNVRKVPPKVNQVITTRSRKKSANSLVPAKNTEPKTKKNLKQTKLTDTGIISTPDKPKKTVKRTVHKKIVNNTPTTRKKKLDTTLGKLGNETSSTDAQDSPSLLEQVEPKLPKTDFVFETPKKLNILASPVESRKTSITCVSDTYSWTKDISSSSSMTCVSVSSNDFVRIDNRLPIIKITNVDYKLKNKQREDSSLNSSSSSNSFTPRTPESSIKIDTHSLDLSTSSITSPKHTLSQPTTCQNVDQNNQVLLSKKDVVLEKLTKKLKNVDLEIINWIGYNYEVSQIPDNIAQLQKRTINLFQSESDVIFQCQCIKQALNPKETEGNVKKDTQNESTPSVPVNTHKSDTLNNDSVEPNKNSDQIKDNVNRNNNTHRRRTVVTKSYENKFNFDRVKHMTDDLSYDDDDTLSLFAESITGMESSKMDITETNSDNILIDPLEEYIPQPITKDNWNSSNNINYVPSKIAKDSAPTADIKKTVCEKQNADSTSLSKDIEQTKNLRPVTVHTSQTVQKDVTNYSSQYKPWTDGEAKRAPRLMSSFYKSSPGVKSVVFRGICFFNMISGCKNPVCHFPHVILENDEIALKLVRLTEECFVQEYMLLRNWPVLRRKYGMVFVAECKRRDLTRYLVEMAIDFYMKANDKLYREDSILKVEVAEYVMMHLNIVDLNSCEDLLLYSLHRHYRLCDFFMETIADTQNFSRFKRVFINLTNFMTHHRRKFALEVATHMLERLCILPSELPLLEALLTILENTDIAIFANAMMGKFEKQLSALDKSLQDRYMTLKTRYENVPTVKSHLDITPCPNPEPETTIKQLVQNDGGKRYTSPDTTNLDNMNKALDDVIIHRTLDLGNLQRSTSMNSAHSSDSNEENRVQCAPKPSPVYRNWKGQRVLDKIRTLSPVNQPRHFPGPKPRYIYQHSLLGPSPPSFPRRYGPDF